MSAVIENLRERVYIILEECYNSAYFNRFIGKEYSIAALLPRVRKGADVIYNILDTHIPPYKTIASLHTDVLLTWLLACICFLLPLPLILFALFYKGRKSGSKKKSISSTVFGEPKGQPTKQSRIGCGIGALIGVVAVILLSLLSMYSNLLTNTIKLTRCNLALLTELVYDGSDRATEYFKIPFFPSEKYIKDADKFKKGEDGKIPSFADIDEKLQVNLDLFDNVGALVPQWDDVNSNAPLAVDSLSNSTIITGAEPAWYPMLLIGVYLDYVHEGLHKLSTDWDRAAAKTALLDISDNIQTEISGFAEGYSRMSTDMLNNMAEKTIEMFDKLNTILTNVATNYKRLYLIFLLVVAFAVFKMCCAFIVGLFSIKTASRRWWSLTWVTLVLMAGLTFTAAGVYILASRNIQSMCYVVKEDILGAGKGVPNGLLFGSMEKDNIDKVIIEKGTLEDLNLPIPLGRYVPPLESINNEIKYQFVNNIYNIKQTVDELFQLDTDLIITENFPENEEIAPFKIVCTSDEDKEVHITVLKGDAKEKVKLSIFGLITLQKYIHPVQFKHLDPNADHTIDENTDFDSVWPNLKDLDFTIPMAVTTRQYLVHLAIMLMKYKNSEVFPCKDATTGTYNCKFTQWKKDYIEYFNEKLKIVANIEEPHRKAKAIHDLYLDKTLEYNTYIEQLLGFRVIKFFEMIIERFAPTVCYYIPNKMNAAGTLFNLISWVLLFLLMYALSFWCFARSSRDVELKSVTSSSSSSSSSTSKSTSTAKSSDKGDGESNEQSELPPQVDLEINEEDNEK